MKKHKLKLLLKTLMGSSLLFGLFLGNLSTVQAQEKANFALKGMKTVTTGNEYSMPVWSPDGTKLLVATAHGMKLRLVDLKANSIKKLSEVRGSGFDASWSIDGATVYYRHKDTEEQTHPEIKAINLGNYRKSSSDLNPNGLLSASKAAADSDPVIYINVETLGIEATSKDQAACWKITTDNGQYYRPLLSPDKKQLVIHRGSEMLLYTVNGKFVRNLGAGIASSWAPDSQNLLAFMDESKDGHQISGSEIYMISMATGKMSQLTHTPNVYEMWPNWSADGKRVAFEDVKSGNIFVADIVRE